MKLSWASDGDSKVLRSIAHLPPSHSSCFLLSVNILATGHWAHVTCTSIIKMVIVCMTSLNLNTWLEADILISMVLMRALRLTDVQQLGYGPTDISVRCGFSSRAPESQARLFRVACHCLLHSSCLLLVPFFAYPCLPPAPSPQPEFCLLQDPSKNAHIQPSSFVKSLCEYLLSNYYMLGSGLDVFTFGLVLVFILNLRGRSEGKPSTPSKQKWRL